ncbi:MAG: response regulator, partial [Deltaproteobacteria bacterium]|nr:response regulator [Deltaproteobacteria bacterium]
MITGTSKDIIVLEEGGLFRDRLGAMLTEAGHSVVLAHDCAALMDKFASGVRFAALVMDIDMPGADSFSVLEWLRETDTRCPVLFVTDTGGSEDVSSEDEAVFYAPCIISKNQPHAAIMSAINRHLFPDMPSKRAKDRVYGAIPAC